MFVNERVKKNSGKQYFSGLFEIFLFFLYPILNLIIS
jgi:hypothetical protein